MFQIESEKTPYECTRFKVEETVYQTEDGQRKTFAIKPSGDFLIIIPRLESKILLIKNHAPPIPTAQWVFPTGFITPGVALADTAQNILLENTGTVAHRFIYIGKMFPSRYMNAIAHVLVGEGLAKLKDRYLDFQDKVSLYTERQIGTLLVDRKIDDGLTLASYTYYVTSEHFWTEVHDSTKLSRDGSLTKSI